MVVVVVVALVGAGWIGARARRRTGTRRLRDDRLVVGTAAVTIALAATLGIVRFLGGNSHLERGVEGLLASSAFAGLLAAPGLLALLSRHDRPALLVPAGIGAILLSTIAMSGVTLPLLIPGVLLVVAYGRRAGDGTQSRAPVGVVNLVVVAGLAAAVAALFLGHDDPRSYATATGGGGTGDVVTWWESLCGLSLTAMALAAGWCLAAPRPHRPSQPSA